MLQNLISLHLSKITTHQPTRQYQILSTIRVLAISISHPQARIFTYRNLVYHRRPTICSSQRPHSHGSLAIRIPGALPTMIRMREVFLSRVRRRWCSIIARHAIGLRRSCKVLLVQNASAASAVSA